MPTLGLISPVIIVPEGSPDYMAMARGGEIDINRYLIDGVMHYPESAMPDEEGNIVIFGHSNFFKSGLGRYKTIFADIMNLDVGVDEIWLYQLTAEQTYERFVYAIEKSYETVPTDVGILEPKGGKELTVFACTNGLAGRWILRARQLPDDEKNISYEIKQRIDGLLRRFYVLTAEQKQLIRDQILVAIEMKRIRTISPLSASSREVFDYLEKHLLQ